MLTPLKIHYIFSSMGHNYFTRKKFDRGSFKTIEHKSVYLKAGKGIRGDRFEFSKYALTLFSLEVAQEVETNLGIESKLQLFRRNIIVSGLHLNSLIGEIFTIGTVVFEGVSHCAPCPWMNEVMKKGAYSLMQGRGGLRVKVLSPGLLSLGENILNHDKVLDENPLTRIRKMTLPKI